MDSPRPVTSNPRNATMINARVIFPTWPNPTIFNREAWRSFTVIEARRLIDFLGLDKDSGLDGLEKALKFRLYSTLNKDKVERIDDKTLRYYVTTCRVQEARKRKGLPDFPCKSVGIVEYSLFAKTIDKRFDTKCISCPPEVTDENHNCIWEFTLNGEKTE